MPGSSDYADWRERLADANDPAFWPIEAIDRELTEGRAQFWCDGESAIVTRLIEYPGGAKVIEILAAYGHLESLWTQIQPALETYARNNGIGILRATGRLGWARAGKKHGWKAEMVIIEKELT